MFESPPLTIYSKSSLDDSVKAFKDFTLKNLKLRDKLKRKQDKLAHYLTTNRINNVVIGVSGGVDSAVVYKLIESTIKEYFLRVEVHPIHFSHSFHRYDKQTALNNAKLLCGDSLVFGAVTDVVNEMVCSGDWSSATRSQVAYATMYTNLFGIAQHFNAVTIGTTNLDEFGYIGWFGKTSDMVVDLQLITDLHKFEVIELATMLNVPKCIIERTPTGDIASGLSDEQVFNHTYDEVSYFTHVMMNDIPRSFWFDEYFSTLHEMHKNNIHKYQGQTFNPIFIK